MESADGDSALGVFLNAVMDETKRILGSCCRTVKINEASFFYRTLTTGDILVTALVMCSCRCSSSALALDRLKHRLRCSDCRPSFPPSFPPLLQAQENVFVEFNHQQLLEFYNKVS